MLAKDKLNFSAEDRLVALVKKISRKLTESERIISVYDTYHNIDPAYKDVICKRCDTQGRFVKENYKEQDGTVITVYSIKCDVCGKSHQLCQVCGKVVEEHSPYDEDICMDCYSEGQITLAAELPPSPLVGPFVDLDRNEMRGRRFCD